VFEYTIKTSWLHLTHTFFLVLFIFDLEIFTLCKVIRSARLITKRYSLCFTTGIETKRYFEFENAHHTQGITRSRGHREANFNKSARNENHEVWLLPSEK
jgi:hypothetical protein